MKFSEAAVAALLAQSAFAAPLQGVRYGVVGGSPNVAAINMDKRDAIETHTEDKRFLIPLALLGGGYAWGHHNAKEDKNKDKRDAIETHTEEKRFLIPLALLGGGYAWGHHNAKEDKNKDKRDAIETHTEEKRFLIPLALLGGGYAWGHHHAKEEKNKANKRDAVDLAAREAEEKRWLAPLLVGSGFTWAHLNSPYRMAQAAPAKRDAMDLVAREAEEKRWLAPLLLGSGLTWAHLNSPYQAAQAEQAAQAAQAAQAEQPAPKEPAPKEPAPKEPAAKKPAGKRDAMDLVARDETNTVEKRQAWIPTLIGDLLMWNGAAKGVNEFNKGNKRVGNKRDVDDVQGNMMVKREDTNSLAKRQAWIPMLIGDLLMWNGAAKGVDAFNKNNPRVGNKRDVDDVPGNMMVKREDANANSLAKRQAWIPMLIGDLLMWNGAAKGVDAFNKNNPRVGNKRDVYDVLGDVMVKREAANSLEKRINPAWLWMIGGGIATVGIVHAAMSSKRDVNEARDIFYVPQTEAGKRDLEELEKRAGPLLIGAAGDTAVPTGSVVTVWSGVNKASKRDVSVNGTQPGLDKPEYDNWKFDDVLGAVGLIATQQLMKNATQGKDAAICTSLGYTVSDPSKTKDIQKFSVMSETEKADFDCFLLSGPSNFTVDADLVTNSSVVVNPGPGTFKNGTLSLQ